MALQLRHDCQRGLQAGDGALGAGPAEITGGDGGEQVQAHIGG